MLWFATLVATWSSPLFQGCELKSQPLLQPCCNHRSIMFQGCEIAIATLIATIEKTSGLRILGPSGCDSGLWFATLIATLKGSEIVVAIRVEISICNPLNILERRFQQGFQSGLQILKDDCNHSKFLKNSLVMRYDILKYTIKISYCIAKLL